ncbi:MAG TPA: hypothetical protein VGL10_00775 [Gammaproteobacteria bacterium]
MWHKIMIPGALLLCSLLANIAVAQVVDPCGYGCPKDGCPQCDKGGPIGNSAEEDTANTSAAADAAEPAVEPAEEAAPPQRGFSY